MKVAVTGTTGLVGTELIEALHESDHQVVRLIRGRPSAGANEVLWDYELGSLDQEKLEGVDAFVHLAGENIASRRWNSDQMKKIRDTRVNATRFLVDRILKLKKQPKVFVCASAIGFYGNRGDEVLTEESTYGAGFLAEVCREWEEATLPLSEKGVRVVNLRFGIVLSKKGGALTKMLPPFKAGLGGVIGNGRQYWSWVGIKDVVGIILHAMQTSSLEGPINAVSPQPLTNAEFTKILGGVLKRPTVFPMPAFIARTAIGKMADALLLSSARVSPKKLIETNYRFSNSDLQTTLQELLI